MRWPWQKKPDVAVPVKPKKPRTRMSLAYEDQEFDVGCTTALIVFKDGREVHTKFYGNVDQYVSRDYDFHMNGLEEVKVYPACVISSVDVYKNYLNNIQAGQEAKIVDDWNNPMCSWIGLIYHFEIVETVPYVVRYSVARLVEDPNGCLCER